VDSTLASMDLDTLIGQVFMPVIFDWEPETVAKTIADLERFQPGGLCVFNASLEGTLQHMPGITASTRIPLLCAGDMESGIGHTMGCGQRFPRPMCRAYKGTARDEYEIGRITAVQGRAIGLSMTFSPVIDLNTHPHNPDINIRAYGQDLRTVTRLAIPHVRGLQDHGMLATVKHFPGNGGTEMEPHLGPAIINTPASRYRKNWIEAYRRVFAEADPGAIMAGFLVVPSIMQERDQRTGELVPACLSHEIMTGLLREELGFKGLAISDALDMGGGNGFYSQGELAVRALQAGVDMCLCFSSQSDISLELGAVRKACDEGRLSIERLREAARRVLEAKAKVGLDQQKSLQLEDRKELTRVLEPVPEINNRILRRGITVLANHEQTLPLQDLKNKKVCLVNIYSPRKKTWFMRHDSGSPEMLVEGLKKRGAEVTLVDIDWDAPENTHLKAIEAAEKSDYALVNIMVVPAWAIGHLYPSMEGLGVFYKGILQKPRIASVVTLFGDPYARRFSIPASACICTLDDTREAFEAVLRIWSGEQGASGRLPVSYKGVFNKGDGIDYNLK